VANSVIASAAVSASSTRRKTCAEVECSSLQAEGAGDVQPPETTPDESQHSKHSSPELYHQLPP